MSSFVKGMVLGSCVTLGACAGQIEDGSTSSQPLQITEHSDTRLVGSFDAGDMVVDFRAISPRDMVGAVEVTVGGQTLTYRIDAELGEIDFEADGVSLTPSMGGALASLHQAIDGYIGRVEDTAAMHESTLFAATRYFAEAPTRGTLVSAYNQVEGLGAKISYNSTGNDGKRCIKRGNTEVAKFTGDHGEIHQAWTVGANGGNQWNGNFECMGRCGVGCGSYDWTLDCLDHDACARHYYASTGPVDHNCGDEYSEAADDYGSFWRRCR